MSQIRRGPSRPSLPRSVWLHVCVAAALVALVVPRSVSAQIPAAPPVVYNYGDRESARSEAMGGAARALGDGTTAIYLNPAGLVLTRAYQLSAVGELAPEVGRQVIAGMMMDSISNRLAAGVAASAGFYDPQHLDRQSVETRVALAYPLGDRVGIGLSGRYIRVTQAALGPLGSSKASGGLITKTGREPLVHTATFDAGINIRLAQPLVLAVVGQNLTYPNHALLPTTFGGGLGYSGERFAIEVDGLADFSSWGRTSARVMAGLEVVLFDAMPLRAGYRFDEGANEHSISFGTGYVSRELAIEISGRRALSDVGPTSVLLSFSYYLTGKLLGGSSGGEAVF